jgi:WD40 repeat protein
MLRLHLSGGVNMRFLPAFLLLWLLCSPVALTAQPQPEPLAQHKGDFGFTDRDERIVWVKYLERDNRLLLIGYHNLQLLDVGQAKVLESYPVTLPTRAVRNGYSTDDWAISPDGRKMLIVGHPDAKVGDKQYAWIWDLRTGKRLAVLDKSPAARIRQGLWSKDGRTLVTFDDGPLFDRALKLVVSFWDGETFEYRHSISVDNPTWTYLSDDGKRFFAASGRKKSVLGVKYVSDSRGVINVWDVGSGQIEKTISVSNDEFNARTSKISVSPDEKFLVFVNKHKSKATEHRLLAWEIEGSIYPKYELKANPKIADSSVRFSPDGKYFAVDAGKTLQIYETRSGEKRFEFPADRLPDLWFNHSQTLIYRDNNKMEAFEAANGKKLYEQYLIFETYPNTNSTYDMGFMYQPDYVADRTTIVAHPGGQMFLTYSKQYLNVFDARTGDLLQTLVSPTLAEPEVGFCKKYPQKCRGSLLWKADWSTDGKTLYVLHANGQTVSLWGMPEN